MSAGRFLMLLGAALFLAGLALSAGFRLPLGRLPGDFVWRRGGFSLYLPLGTSLLLSALFTLLAWLLRR